MLLFVQDYGESCARAAALQKLILFERMLSIVGGYDVQISQCGWLDGVQNSKGRAFITDEMHRWMMFLI
jgi:hypothetical protein